VASFVEYILSLKDDLSKGIENANTHVKTLEHNIKGVSEILGVLGVSMGAFAGYEALKGAHEVWEKMEFSISQVEAGLKSTAGAAGLSFEEIKESAEKTAHSVKFAQSEILGMQSVMLTFPAITKESFQPATDIIIDMSTRLGQDLKSSAIQVGKALQDPIKGVTALRRVGVNFNETQTEIIKNLAETNHLAEAQGLIMKELNLEFGGSAVMAAAADAGFKYQKSMEDIRLEVGQLIDELQKELMPAALRFLEWVKASVDWIKQHTSMLESLVKGLAAGALAFKTMTLFIVPFVEGMAAIAPVAATAAVGLETVGVAATTALGPLGLLAAAIGAVVYAYSEWSSAQEEQEAHEQKFMENIGKTEEESLAKSQAIWEKKGFSQQQAFDKSISAELEYYENQKKIAFDALGNDVSGDSDIVNQKADKLDIINKKIAAIRGVQTRGLIPSKAAKAISSDPVAKDKTKSTATGSKSVTINVSIKDLIGVNNINTTNIKEGNGKLQEAITRVLVGAVNDFQLLAVR
jgi:hypothetical protein